MSKRRQSYRSQNNTVATSSPVENASGKGKGANKGANTTNKQRAIKAGKKSIREFNPWLVALIPAVVIFVAIFVTLLGFPHSEQLMEGLNFFVWTPEFVAHKLAEYPGLNNFATAWLIQFFKAPVLAAFIEAALLAIMTYLASVASVAWGKKANLWLSLITAVGLGMMFTHRPAMSMEGIFFFGAIVVVGLIRNVKLQVVKPLALVVIGLLSFWMISFPITVLLMIVLSLMLWMESREKLGSKETSKNAKILLWVNIVLPLVFIVVTIVSVFISSNCFDFIALDRRWWYTKDTGENELWYVLFFAIPAVSILLKRVGNSLIHLSLTVMASVVGGILCYHHISTKEGYVVAEKVYEMADLAEDSQWQELLTRVNEEGVGNTVYLQFALLAESGLGTLPENLFTYPINTPESFAPRLDKKPLSVDFCRIFYRELGFLDESYHQSFQYGMIASLGLGFCAKSLRNMAEYCVKQGDKPIAEKYLWLLEHTSNNGDFVAEQKELLKTVKPVQDTIRANNFAQAYPFDTEMAHYLDNDKSNKKVLDYLLCGLLLNKQLQEFSIVLNTAGQAYFDKPLPKAYAEAAAMIKFLKPDALNEHIKYAPEYDQQFKKFVEQNKSGQDVSLYQGTFWFYHTFAEIPPRQGWMQNGGQTS